MKLKPDYSSMTVLRVSLRKSNVLRVIMPFILTMFILFWNINPLLSSELYSRDKVRKIRLVYGLTVSNRGDHAIQNVTVRIPIIQDHLPYQTATITSITPSVFSREKRGKGSSTARFLIDRIAPDEKKAFLICADVEISEVTYNVQEKKAVNSDASMRQYLLPDGCFGTKSPALREKCREFSHERNPLKKALKIYEYLISGTFSFSNSPVSSGVLILVLTRNISIAVMLPPSTLSCAGSAEYRPVMSAVFSTPLSGSGTRFSMPGSRYTFLPLDGCLWIPHWEGCLRRTVRSVLHTYAIDISPCGIHNSVRSPLKLHQIWIILKFTTVFLQNHIESAGTLSLQIMLIPEV